MVEIEMYDLCVVNPVRVDVPTASLPFAFDRLKRRGMIHMGLPLRESREVLAVVRAAAANAYLVPTKYRDPPISMEQARSRAMVVHAEKRALGQRLAELDEGYDDMLWWTFCADDLDAVEKDLVPGCVRIAVDKRDGHIRSPQEYRDWLQLSKG